MVYSPNYIDKKSVDSEIRGFEKLNDWSFLLLPRVHFPLFYQCFCDLFLLMFLLKFETPEGKNKNRILSSITLNSLLLILATSLYCSTASSTLPLTTSQDADSGIILGQTRYQTLSKQCLNLDINIQGEPWYLCSKRLSPCFCKVQSVEPDYIRISWYPSCNCMWTYL